MNIRLTEGLKKIINSFFNLGLFLNMINLFLFTFIRYIRLENACCMIFSFNSVLKNRISATQRKILMIQDSSLKLFY